MKNYHNFHGFPLDTVDVLNVKGRGAGNRRFPALVVNLRCQIKRNKRLFTE